MKARLHRAIDADRPLTHDGEHVVIFDLDGTLVDSVDGIALAINRLLRSQRAAPLSRRESAALLGDGLEAFARRAFQLRGLTLKSAQLEQFLDNYLAHPLDGAKLYPGVEATLNLLAQTGGQLAVCTNKSEAPARLILDGQGILDRFEVVCCGDTVTAQKPQPEHIAQTLLRGGWQGLPAVMVGDNRVDVAAASAYGIPSVFAGWGYGAPPDDRSSFRFASAFTQLPELVNELFSRAT